MQEAKIYGDAVELASSADKTFSYIPDCSDLDHSQKIWIMFTFARTILSTEQSTRSFQTQRERTL